MTTKIEENKQKFLNYVQELKAIPGADIDGLIAYLEGSDFFEAPASTIYHSSFKGGLVAHSLNVLENLFTLADIYTPNKYSRLELLTVALFHDISKANFYEVYVQNKKVYSPNGSKFDAGIGKYDWVSTEAFKVKDNQDRYLCGTHGMNSYMILSRFLPLSEEEISAIVNHHAGMDDMGSNKDMSAILNRYPLATLLHLADMTATYINERI